MSTYLQTVNEIRSAATSVNPLGTFDHGRRVDLSQESIKVKFPYVFLLPIDISDADGDSFFDSSVILMRFLDQDKPASSMHERELLIHKMDLLVDSFLNKLRENTLVSVTASDREPEYQVFNGTASGMIVRFTYRNFTPCID